MLGLVPGAKPYKRKPVRYSIVSARNDKTDKQWSSVRNSAKQLYQVGAACRNTCDWFSQGSAIIL